MYAPLSKCMPISVIPEQTKATSHQNSTRRRFIRKKNINIKIGNTILLSITINATTNFCISTLLSYDEI